MDFIPLIGILIAAFIAWKLLKGIIKLAVIGFSSLEQLGYFLEVGADAR